MSFSLENNENQRQRPRANTSISSAFSSWRRYRPDSTTPLSSTPAAPIQTLPIESLIQSFESSTVPSLTHARSLAVALSTQTPTPSPATMTRILSSLCTPSQPIAFQAAGCEALCAYCSCGVPLSTSDKLAYFNLIRTTSSDWTTELWEPRLKALNAVLSSPEDSLGIEKLLLDTLASWIHAAVDELMENATAPLPEKHEVERSVEALSEALSSWFTKIEDSGRMSEEFILAQYDFLENLVNQVVTNPAETSLHSSLPATPFRENSSTSLSGTPQRHRRHPSSTSNLNSPLGAHTLQPTRPTNRHPGHLVTILYLNFLDIRMERLPSTYLPKLMPLLFRILSFVMTPLPSISAPMAPRSAATERQAIEQRVVKCITSLLSGPYSTTCLKLMKYLLCPCKVEGMDAETQVRTSVGAIRTLRLQVRQVLEDKLARLYVSRETSSTSTPAGAPGGLSFSDYLLERAQRAWKPDSGSLWDAKKVRGLLVITIRSWIAWQDNGQASNVARKERVLEEVACLLKDVLQEMDDPNEAEERDGIADDTARAVGETFLELVNYVKTLRSEDGSPIPMSLGLAMGNSSPFLRLLADLLGRDQNVTFTNPPLAMVLLPIADHLPDADTAKIPDLMFLQHQLDPTSSDWLDNWDMLFGETSLFSASRPLTRRSITSALNDTFTLVVDMPSYRRALMNRVFDFWMKMIQEGNEGMDGALMWKLLGDEVVLRSAEEETDELFTPANEDGPGPQGANAHKILVAMISVSGYCDCHTIDDQSFRVPDSATLSPLGPATPATTTSPASPVASRAAPDSSGNQNSNGVPQQLMSLLSFGSGSGSRQQSSTHVPQLVTLDDASSLSIPQSEMSPPAMDTSPSCRGVVAIVALINVFSQLAFADSVMTPRQSGLAIYVFQQLLKLLRTAQCARSRLAILQALMRLRADRDHRVYMKRDPAENEPHILTLASLIDRIRESASPGQRIDDARSEEINFDELRKARPKQPFMERDGRRTSRGRGSRTSTGSRSRSRVTLRKMQQMTTITRPKVPIWFIQDSVLFVVNSEEKPSQLVITYDTSGTSDGGGAELPVSDYLDVLVEILKAERDWEILSFVLVHLPAQLANKHFWCGPKGRKSMANLLAELTKGISEWTLAKYVPPEDWPGSLKQRDAVGLAYHTLTVLISYQSIFEVGAKHGLVEILQAGLNGIPSTVMCCLNALSLCAFELQSSMVRALPRILEKLSQIMTNPPMAVHILTFLSIVASIPSLYSNFTENDFKMVFGVALQYLQHHNRPETLGEISFSLSQHVRIMAFYVVYVWFLNLKLPDRPQHVKFIVRQLLLANEGRDEVDAPTEVCFDWLARYTYASADPKPARSVLSDVLSTPTEGLPSASAVQEKAWVLGYSVITVKTLPKPGWMEVISRRASGTTKFYCRNENFPIVDLGDVAPDMVTIPLSLMMNKNPWTLDGEASFKAMAEEGEEEAVEPSKTLQNVFSSEVGQDSTEESKPDEVTGYVWSGSAPSQRRKHVDMDPSFFSLQFSSYPDMRAINARKKVVKDSGALASFIRTLDRLPVIDTHKIGILYVAPGQVKEVDILRNTHGSPAYTRFLDGLGRLIQVGGQHDVYVGGLEPDEDGNYAYAWWDDIGQMLFHTATLMPTHEFDPACNMKKRHIGNDLVRVVWNDSGVPYRFDTLVTEFQFVNIVIEPHSRGVIAAYSNNLHENEYFRVTVQSAEGMSGFTPIGDFKIASAASLPLLVRQLALVADWYASVFKDTVRDTERNEIVTNWRARLEAIKRFSKSVPAPLDIESAGEGGIMGQESLRDFAPWF